MISLNKAVQIFTKKAQQMSTQQAPFGEDDLRDALRGIVTDVNHSEQLDPKFDSLINQAYEYQTPGDYTVTVSVTPPNNVDVKVGANVNRFFHNKIPAIKAAVQEYLAKIPAVSPVSVTFGNTL